jgi:hypothetical protein
MSNCDLVAARSLIALAASRLALRAPALRAATALTRPNGSAQRLHSDRHAVPTAMTVGPNKVVDYAKREHLRKPSLLMRAHVSLFAAPPRKVSAAKMFRKPKEFAQHFKRHFLKRHLHANDAGAVAIEIESRRRAATVILWGTSPGNARP